MNRATVLSGVAILAIAGIATAVALSTNNRRPIVEPTPAGNSTTPSASPSPQITPIVNKGGTHDPRSEYGHDAGVDDFAARNPVIAALPKENRYWLLQIDGPKSNNRIGLTATVKVEHGADDQQAIERFRPEIIKYLDAIGQRPDTYVLEFTTVQIDSYFSG